jgi:hypothetical protein
MSNESFISKIKQVSASNKIDCFVRSNNSTASFLPISIKQQKDIIKTAMDVITSPITFANTTTEIINTNLINKTSISILDKPLILLALRINSLGPQALVNVGEERVKADISECLNFKTPIVFSDIPQAISFDKIEVSLKVPTIEEDFKVNIECKKTLDNKKTKDEERFKDLVGELYIYEVSKFIDTVKINNESGVDEVKFSNLSVQQGVETLEALPMVLTNKLVECIAKIRGIESEPLKIQVNGVDATITLDSAFFARE